MSRGFRTVATMLLAAVLRFTLPSYNAPKSCDPDSTSVLHDLGTVQGWGQQRGRLNTILLRNKNVRGREGLADSLELPIDASVWTAWVTTRDTLGNQSCQSPPVGFNLTTGVPPDSIPLRHEEWFDVAGRRVKPPIGPGVYIVRTGTRTRKVVKL